MSDVNLVAEIQMETLNDDEDDVGGGVPDHETSQKRDSAISADTASKELQL